MASSEDAAQVPGQEEAPECTSMGGPVVESVAVKLAATQQSLAGPESQVSGGAPLQEKGGPCDSNYPNSGDEQQKKDDAPTTTSKLEAPALATTESILQLLVTEDMSSIRSAACLRVFFTEHLFSLPPKVTSEVLSILIAIVKKSVFHLELARGLLVPCIRHLLSSNLQAASSAPVQQQESSLTKHFLREWINLLIAHSCDVDELNTLIAFSENDPTLLNFVKQANLRQRNRPPAFFAFPGTRGSMMSLPPFQKWPIQLGWSFSTWFFLEPKACAQPYLYNFKTGKSGLGYSAHFTGNCLVLTSIKVKGKGVQHCVAYEFPSYKWIHCAITYHNKWRASEIKVYVNGQLSANIDMAWQVQTTEPFDKCFIGGSGSMTSSDRSGEVNSFCGQMSSLYLFNEGLSPAQICAIHRLGSSYMGQFKYSNESNFNLPPQICKVIYEEKLASTLFCLYTPAAVDSGTLCIQLAPLKSSTSGSAQNYFISAPHAALVGQTKAITTQSICSTLQSLGCSRTLFPLLEIYVSNGDSAACSSLIGFLCDLLESSPHWFANEIVQNNGFVLVACALSSNSRLLITEKLLDIFLNLTRTSLTTSTTASDSLLLKHLMDNILFNPTLWIYAETKLQIKLYNYLATEFLHGTRQTSNKYTASSIDSSSPYLSYIPTTNAIANQSLIEDQSKLAAYECPVVTDILFGDVRRVSTVLQSLHALKYFYWVSMEKNINHKCRNFKLRPEKDELVIIRSHILEFVRDLIKRANSTPSDEIQGILNYLSSCSHPDNVLDVLGILVSLLKDLPSRIVTALEQKQGLKVIFTLIGSKSEQIRIQSLRLLSLFLSRCTHKRKQDIMNPHNLFTLLSDKLRPYKPLSPETYEALLNIVIEHDYVSNAPISGTKDLKKKRIENSTVVRVIATLLHEQKDCEYLRSSGDVKLSRETDIRLLFIDDLWNLIVNNKENRRIILQMSVWQHWLINLIYSTIDDSQLVKDQVLSIFRILLYHAIHYEYGGWRVWIDTLAIIHTKVSYDEFYRQLNADSSSPISSKFKEMRIESSSPTSKLEETKKETSHKASNISKDEGDGIDLQTETDGLSNESQLQVPVSSISERIPRVSSGIKMDANTSAVGDSTGKLPETTKEESLQITEVDDVCDSSELALESSQDTVDVAPSRIYRKLSLTNETEQPEAAENDESKAPVNSELIRQASLTSIPLEESSNDSIDLDEKSNKEDEENAEEMKEIALNDVNFHVENIVNDHEPTIIQSQKVTASPAFRIPEFKWSNILIKLLNDLLFSIECDLYQWRCSAKCSNLDQPPFTPNSSSNVQLNSNQSSSAKSLTAQNSVTHPIETILQRPDHQTYLVNLIHFVSQLADNIVIAAGGLLPLLADATGGGRASSLNSNLDPKSGTCEGLTMPQANSLLYRLVNMVDIVIFAASHINLSELEADKNTTTGSILRQCLRLACTVTVKNCLVVRSINNKITELGIDGEYTITSNDFPKEMFDSYQGCSLLSANGLFEHSALSIETSDLVANVDFSPHQTPNTGVMPSLLPFQSVPIKDPNKLLQAIDIHRIQACIYHDMSTESRQSQFLALSSLYFISVLMVSKYRDIIEPKHKSVQRETQNSITAGSTSVNAIQNKDSISSIEANLLSFGQIQPTVPDSNSSATTLTDLLTTKLENTLNTVCPLLQAIMCDFRLFLSKTLIGSHGQDLVLKETERTFKRSNASPVELVMLLCSQEWQNTLQKNAGLAFIELINEGRVLSHGMKDHIVRVAMEAEFIMSRLRADDVAKHEQFNSSCSETFSARLHEEVLINSLITSATRRDYVIHSKFRESMQKQSQRNYKLDIWEDDDRRRRRFVIDCWDDSEQCFYPSQPKSVEAQRTGNKIDTKEVLDMHQTIELTGFDNQCSSGGIDTAECEANLGVEDEDCEDYESDDNNNDSNSHYSDNEHAKDGPQLKPKDENFIEGLETTSDKRSKSHFMHKAVSNKLRASGAMHELDDEVKRDYDEFESMNDFTGSVIFAAECSLVWNIYAVPGVLQLTSYELYFEPNQNISDRIDLLKRKSKALDSDEDQDGCMSKDELSSLSAGVGQRGLSRKIDLKVLRYCDFLTCNGKIPLVDIRAIFLRNYLFQPHALEIFLSHRTSVMFAFSDYDTVKRVVKHLPPVGVGIKYGIPQSRRASLMSPKQLFAASNMTQKWKRREIGNFQYLMFLNTVAGRTYQDLNQYPVFPWILTNYDSEELDLNLPSNFRDLSKPIGALNSKRRAEFIKRYENWDNPKVPAFHYGTHYSTGAFTLGWLCRLRGANNSAYLALQDGDYEPENRLFRSIGDAWVSSLVGDQQNVKELIPEFFYLPEMFRASLGIPEVEYPPWAKNAEHFIRTHRLALESELVSCQLHQWIDLIFGYKQRGPEAVNAVNTFYYLTYQGSVNFNMIQDPALREAIESQIKHFGQTPSQLTTDPHPPRFSALHVSPMLFSPSSIDELNKVIKYPFKTSIMYISPCIEGGYVNSNQADNIDSSSQSNHKSSTSQHPSSILTITSNNQYQIHKWRPNDQSAQPLAIDPQLEQSSGARRQLIDVDDLCPAVSLKANTIEEPDVVDEVQWACTHYVVTLNSRFIIMASFYDNSFRVFSAENGKLCQVIYGHKAPITCMCRSDGNAVADFYVATGSQDCSLLLWTWNDKYAQIEGSGVSVAHNPLPKLTISGHRTAVLSVVICAELGLIISGSKNFILVHTTTTGENLLEIDVILPNLLNCSLHDSKTPASSEHQITVRPTVEDKQKTILEASMLGDASSQLPNETNCNEVQETAKTVTPELDWNKKSLLQLKDLCHSDYYITNLQVARELGFIVCIALPFPRKKSKTSSDPEPQATADAAKPARAALLMTFNLKGALMESTTIGQPVTGIRLGDVSILKTTRDGEYTILNDSATSLKVYRTFDLHPVYAYNMNDLPGDMSQDQEQSRIRSLALIEQKYILVGLENGRIVVYNADLINMI